MNRRQKKKAFKKKYGFNPTKKNIDFMTDEIMKVFLEAKEIMLYTLEYTTKEFIPNISQSVREIIEKISVQISGED